GRLSNSAYRRVHGAHWRALENGGLRFRAPVASVVPSRNQDHRSVAACAGGLLDRVRSTDCVGAARFEANDRVSLDQPSRLLHAGSFRTGRVTRCCCEYRHACSTRWRVHANLQSRHYRGDAFLLCGPARTTARSPGYRRFWWPDAADAAALRLDECRDVFVARLAGPERIYWRVSDF